MKVGDYVRTKDGRIGQYIKPELGTPYITNRIEYYEINKGKYSPNIIDLIEVGDYVNGYLVYEIKENCVMVGYKCFKTELDNEEDFLYQTIYANNIKSIITREQIKSMEYKIGE